MPGISGIEVMQRLRAEKIDIPIIFLTVLSEQIYEEAGLLGGAVDFVEKSRSFAILQRRIELILGGDKKRWQAEAPVTRQAHDGLILRYDSSRALWRDVGVDLTLTEFNIVSYLTENAQRDVSYREIYDIVHGEGFMAGRRRDRIPHQCAGFHQAHPAEIPRCGSAILTHQELPGLRLQVVGWPRTIGASLWRLVHSFTLKLILLALVLLSVPLILYWQFARAEQEQLALIRNAVVQTNHVLAAMLRGHFEKFASEPAGEMREALRARRWERRISRYLVRLKGSDNFLYVASVPSVSQQYLDAERAELIRSGLFQRLRPSCDGSANLDMRFVNPDGKQEVLAAMTPVHVNGNCWIVITSENASSLSRTPIGLPFWRAPTILVAGTIYLISTALILWLFFHMWRNVRRSRRAARHIRLRDSKPVSFRRTNTIPELTGVAEDFDSLVDALTGSQRRMKEAAEENSHALKTPLAVIAQSVEPA